MANGLGSRLRHLTLIVLSCICKPLKNVGVTHRAGISWFQIDHPVEKDALIVRLEIRLKHPIECLEQTEQGMLLPSRQTGSRVKSLFSYFHPGR